MARRGGTSDANSFVIKNLIEIVKVGRLRSSLSVHNNSCFSTNALLRACDRRSTWVRSAALIALRHVQAPSKRQQFTSNNFRKTESERTA